MDPQSLVFQLFLKVKLNAPVNVSDRGGGGRGGTGREQQDYTWELETDHESQMCVKNPLRVP